MACVYTKTVFDGWLFDPANQILILNTRGSISLPKDWALLFLFDSVVSLVVFDALGQAEVPYLHHTFTFHQHIACCQVSVDVVLGSQVIHSLKSRNND